MVMVNMFVLTGPPGCQPFCERVQISCMDLIIQKTGREKGQLKTSSMNRRYGNVLIKTGDCFDVQTFNMTLIHP